MLTQNLPTATGQWTPLVLTPAEQTADYTRRIHWWIRLFGVAWLASWALGLVFAVYLISAASART